MYVSSLSIATHIHCMYYVLSYPCIGGFVTSIHHLRIIAGMISVLFHLSTFISIFGHALCLMHL